MADVRFRNATRVYRKATSPAVCELDLSITDGEFMVLVGPSGSGKTTALRMLAGLEGVDGGSVHIGDTDVTTLPPSRRDIAMVFQNYALYPHLTVAANIGYHLRIARRPKAEIARKVADAAGLLGLTELLDRRPASLSGGQRQRVAMGRAMVSKPKVFLLDEPLSNLDAQLRVQTRGQIAALHRTLRTTTVYVTHDQVEAMTLGDRVAVLHHGLLQQVGTPTELFERPANVFVAGFIGSPAMNLFDVPAADPVLGGHRLRLTDAQRSALTGDTVTVGIRPEGLSLAPAGEGLAATVAGYEEVGSDGYVHLTPAGRVDGDPVVLRCPPHTTVGYGDAVGVTIRPELAHLFDGAGGTRLPGQAD